MANTQENMEDSKPTASSKKKTVKEEKDALQDFLSGITGLSDSMKKRVHKVLNTEGIVDPRGIKSLTKKQLEELPGITDATASLLLDQFKTKQSTKLYPTYSNNFTLHVLKKLLIT